MSAVLYVWRQGNMSVGARCPDGAITLATGPARRLRLLKEVRGRHTYDGRSHLVPGVPEADTEEDALKAVGLFLKWLHASPEPGVSLSPVPDAYRDLPLEPVLPRALREGRAA